MTTSSPHRRSRRRLSGASIGWLLLIVAVIGTVVLGLSPTPYVVEKPGPVYDVLGSSQSAGKKVPLIGISGEKTYPTAGSLDMLTVYVDGSPQQRLSWIQLASSWFDPTRSVVPIDDIYPPGQTDEEANQQDEVDMADSQQDAQAAALTALGIDYTTTVVVGQVLDGAPADGVLKAGDEVLTVAGEKVTDLTVLQNAIQSHGTDTPIALGISRDGTDETVDITPQVSSDTRKPAIGIVTGARYTFPFRVTFSLDNVGGPSAGMMLAIGIYDKLTPGDLVGGRHIAGTGTITADGTVGAIGGIRQKMYGARGAGADWFLAPASNCNEVVGHVPSGLKVYAVGTLDAAIADVKAIAAGETAGLKTCNSQ